MYINDPNGRWAVVMPEETLGQKALRIQRGHSPIDGRSKEGSWKLH